MFWVIIGLIVVIAMALGGSPGARSFLTGLGTIAKVFLGCLGVLLLMAILGYLLFGGSRDTREKQAAPQPAAAAPVRKSPAPPKQAPAAGSKSRPSDTGGDPCAVGISIDERLRRMEKLGTVRQTGTHTYEVGNHTLMLNHDGTEMVICR